MKSGTAPRCLLANVRALLILGRVSNLPTVWSNCLAGWFLAGAGNAGDLPWLFVGATSLYVGGMFLNDAFDVGFDRQHRQTRPIPSGAISSQAVWIWGFAWLIGGVACLSQIGWRTGGLGLGLAMNILIYDATHKRISFAPVLMGGCRFLLYLVAAATAGKGVTSLAVWFGLALGGYIVGLSYLARRESGSGAGAYMRIWPLMLLAGPVGAAVALHGFREGPLLLSAVLLLWMIRCLRYTFQSLERNISRTVSGLLAGIVLVDWLAASDAPREMGFVFIGLFLTALLLQRFVPAT